MVKRFFLILMILFSVSSIAFAKDAQDLNYEIEGAGTGSQGTYLIKITVISKKSKINDELIARCAVHGVLFKGFNNKELRQNQRPLAGNAATEAQHADFFKDFFAENGSAKNYVASVSGSRQVVKAGKQYKISTIVTVNKEQLHKDLETAGIIKGLNSGF